MTLNTIVAAFMMCLTTPLFAMNGCRPDPPTQAPPSGPPHHNPGHEEACQSYSSRGATFTCEYDSECGICHDGSPCGTPMTATEIAARDGFCQESDSAQCEPFAARCCGGRCVFASF